MTTGLLVSLLFNFVLTAVVVGLLITLRARARESAAVLRAAEGGRDAEHAGLERVIEGLQGGVASERLAWGRERAAFLEERRLWAEERRGLTDRQLLYRGSPPLGEDLYATEPPAGEEPREETLEDLEAQFTLAGATGAYGGRGLIAQRQAARARLEQKRLERNQGTPPDRVRAPHEPTSPHDEVTEDDKAALTAE